VNGILLVLAFEDYRTTTRVGMPIREVPNRIKRRSKTPSNNKKQLKPSWRIYVLNVFQTLPMRIYQALHIEA
jgi:hypothetical protein